MQAELKIKEILGGQSSIDVKVNIICQFMNWDKKELTDAIIKHGTSSEKGRDDIIGEFWGELSEKRKRGRR